MKKVTVVANATGKNKTAAANKAVRQIAAPAKSNVIMLKPAPRAKTQADVEEAEESLRTSRSIPTYLVADCNYNDWREWGKYIANGWAVPSVNKQNELEIGYTKPEDAVAVARHIQNRNLDQMKAGIAAGSVQKYDGYVIAQEGDIQTVINNINAFYKAVHKLNGEMKEMFTVLPKFTLTHPAKHTEISNTTVTAAPARNNKNNSAPAQSNTKQTLAIAAKGLTDVAKLLASVEA